MPNHVHAFISFIDTPQSINTIVGNGKRFMAYEIIARLQAENETDLLQSLKKAVEAKRKHNNKKHEVWKLSFDWKDCRSNDFVWQKLDYMHNNPCTGKWQLAENALLYPHSSARFYLTGEQEIYHIRNFMEMEDVVFNKRQE